MNYAEDRGKLYREPAPLICCLMKGCLKQPLVTNKNMYNTYMYGNTVAEIRNLHNADGAKLLIIGDSFTDVAEPFLALALGFSKLDCIDLRTFTGSLQSYITQNGSYDAVLISL